jgi:DNA primase
MPGIDYQAVRRAVPMQQVLDLLRFEATESRADERRGPCPVHRPEEAKSRTFSANLVQHCYRCFDCGSKGNQLDLWAKANALSLHAAAIDLCRCAGIEVPWIQRWSDRCCSPDLM